MSLQQLLNKSKTPSLKDVASILKQLCAAVSALHSCKGGAIVHKDISARNVLISGAPGSYRAKLTDFGLTASFPEQHFACNIFSRVILLVRWLAPESFTGIFSEKSDIWSVGVTAWETFALAVPFEKECGRDNVSELGSKVGKTLFLTAPENCPDEFWAIINQCCSTNPKIRPSASWLADEFGKIESEI